MNILAQQIKPNMICKKLLKNSIECAIKELYLKDIYLINTKPVDYNNYNHVSERGIVFRLGIYLEKYLLENTSFFGYNLDAEYNRNIYNRKILPSLSKGIYPDLIIHKRGDNDYNLIVIEFKTWWNKDVSNDIKKLKEFTSKVGEYQYQYGLSVLLEKDEPVYEWIC